MVTIGVIRDPLFIVGGSGVGTGGSGNNTPIPYLQLRVIAKGEQGGIPNIGQDEYVKEINDVVEGYKDANFYWEAARFNGGDGENRNNYTPLVEIELDEAYVPPVVVPPVVVPPTPTINFGSVSCRSLGSCNDNSTCAVKFPITTSNAPAGSYIEMIQTASTSASATLNNDSGVFSITYQETTAVGASVNFTLYLKNSLGATIATSDQTITHQSYWSMIANCTVTTPVVSYSFGFSSPGRSSSSLSCAQTAFPLMLYAAVNTLDLGVQLFINSDLSTPVGSGNLWYQYGIDGISYRIDNGGFIAEAVNCVVETPTLYKSLVSFDYKGVGDITFRYKLHGTTVYAQYTFTGLSNSGGIYFTYTLDADVGDPNLCIELGSFERVSGSIVNTNNFIYSEESCVLP
ncbi:hypothetical protein ACM55F_09970 [Flavobacterium sp. XS2P12]|uniref:hypothetical protein n=1 Tax=Flavobacterium melibiosi TaxID=3398734 RepID=UPI003A84CC49